MTSISKNQVNFYSVGEADEHQRLDNLLIKILKGVPKSYIYRIIRGGEVRVNKKRAEVSDKVEINDVIRIPPVRISEKLEKSAAPKSNFPVLFEDDYFLIINKPDGVACHGGSGISFGVIEQLRQTYLDYKFLELVHRLDKDTSGILIIAKKRQALVAIQDMIKHNQMQKFYYALSVGKWVDNKRNIKVPLFKYLTKDGERRVRVQHDEASKYANTIFTVVKSYGDFTLVKAELKTGRTHQIRVHLQHIDHPIAGDDKYGNFELNKQLFKAGLKRMFLHACQISFVHPITNKEILIVADLPDNLNNFLDSL